MTFAWNVCGDATERDGARFQETTRSSASRPCRERPRDAETNAAVDGLGVVPTTEAASNDMCEPQSVARHLLLFGYTFFVKYISDKNLWWLITGL